MVLHAMLWYTCVKNKILFALAFNSHSLALLKDVITSYCVNDHKEIQEPQEKDNRKGVSFSRIFVSFFWRKYKLIWVYRLKKTKHSRKILYNVYEVFIKHNMSVNYFYLCHFIFSFIIYLKIFVCSFVAIHGLKRSVGIHAEIRVLVISKEFRGNCVWMNFLLLFYKTFVRFRRIAFNYKLNFKNKKCEFNNISWALLNFFFLLSLTKITCKMLLQNNKKR